MKKRLYNILWVLFAVTSLTLVACGDDDSDDIISSEGKFTINGKSWSLGEDPVFYGYIGDGIHKVDLVFARIEQDDDFLCPSKLTFDITTYSGTHIGIGTDLATSENIFWGGGNGLYDLYLNFDWSGDEVGYTTYGHYGQSMKVSGGSAVITEYVAGELLTIKFGKYTLPLDTSEYHSSDAPETLVLDGTITFMYTDVIPY